MSWGQSARNPPRMVVRMALVEASEGGGIHSWVKWRRKRALRGCLPPPVVTGTRLLSDGKGAKARKKQVSTVVVRSYPKQMPSVFSDCAKPANLIWAAVQNAHVLPKEHCEILSSTITAPAVGIAIMTSSLAITQYLKQYASFTARAKLSLFTQLHEETVLQSKAVARAEA